MADMVKVRLAGPVWDEDGTLYREGTREVPRALAVRLGAVKSAKSEPVADDDAASDKGGEGAGDDAGTKATKTAKAAKGKGK